MSLKKPVDYCINLYDIPLQSVYSQPQTRDIQMDDFISGPSLSDLKISLENTVVPILQPDYHQNIIKSTILNNNPIEDLLNVIIVISNPCQSIRRYTLAKEFIKRITLEETQVNLCIVELVYGSHKFILTDKANPNHLQLKGDTPLWHKENMINLGIRKLLPDTWKAVAWIDADIEFESPTWVSDTLKLLNGAFDIVQIFSHCADLDQNEKCMQHFSSAGYQYMKNGFRYKKSNDLDFSHPGYAWAITRDTYEKIGGLYELSILGSSDHNMLLCLFGLGSDSLHFKVSDGYKKSMALYESKLKMLRFGYVPTIIRHYFHGSKKNRKYTERWNIIVDSGFNPLTHLTYDSAGLLIPTGECPKKLLDDILKYFVERNEDEYFK